MCVLNKEHYKEVKEWTRREHQIPRRLVQDWFTEWNDKGTQWHSCLFSHRRLCHFEWPSCYQERAIIFWMSIQWWRGIFQHSRHCWQEELMEGRSRTSGLVWDPFVPGDRTSGPNSEKEYLFHLIREVHPLWGWEWTLTGVTLHEPYESYEFASSIQLTSFHPFPLLFFKICISFLWVCLRLSNFRP